MTGKRRRDAAETRAAILDAAEDIMRNEGYAAVSSRRVAERAGSKTMPVHYHFGSMDDLFLALYRRSEDKHFNRLTKALTSATALRDLWELGRDPADSGLIGEYLALANHRPALREEVARSGERVRAIETAIIASTLKKGGQPQFGDASPAVLAFILEAVCRTLVAERALGIEAAHAEIESFVEQILDQVE